MDLIYLWQGKLFIKEGDKPPRNVESEFARDMAQAAREIQRKREWKTTGQGARFAGGGALWGAGDADPDAIPVSITAVTRGDTPEKLLYAVETNRVGGLFLYDRTTRKEQRLFHREHFRIRDLARHGSLPLTVGCIPAPDNTSCIAVISDDRPIIDEVTSGDSLDEAPSWVPGDKKQIVFQSAGIARDEQGYFHSAGPFAIHKLDIDSGDMDVLLEDERHDLLLPRMNSTGDLFFIRRPYEARPKLAFTSVLLDTVLFPFRLIYAFVHFFNFFSLMFSKKPLITAGGPKTEGPQMRDIILRGKVLDARRALKANGEQPDAPALVPGTWQLIRRTPDGAETVLAKAVVAFDLVDDQPIYTNGRCVYSIDAQQRKHLLLKGQWADSILALT